MNEQLLEQGEVSWEIINNSLNKMLLCFFISVAMSCEI